ncbi:MAG TPA: SRPBCC family protein [Holophagaceae bacterium]|nr:SRPBCC family protein [Holophagaceae bacterium]
MNRSGRIVCTFTMEDLPAPPAEVFPLLCPVREAQWLPDWSAEMLWSRSGVAEDGALFRTPGATGEPWIWQIVQHQAEAGRIRFAIVAPGSHATDLSLQLDPQGAGSRLRWTYTLHALTPSGAAFLKDYEAGFPARMALLDRRLRH